MKLPIETQTLVLIMKHYCAYSQTAMAARRAVTKSMNPITSLCVESTNSSHYKEHVIVDALYSGISAMLYTATSNYAVSDDTCSLFPGKHLYNIVFD